jgi:uncharacterized Zn-binding protein involved in type VI secretion
MDLHTCPMATPIPPSPVPVPHVGGPIMGVCSPNVFIGFQPAARVSDFGMCIPVAMPDPIIKGSCGVFINGLPAARIGDTCAHGGAISTGCPTVLIGESAAGGGGGGGTAKGGQKAVETPPPLSPLASGEAMSAPRIQAKALQAAAASGAPFCAICQKMAEERAARRAAAAGARG